MPEGDTIFRAARTLHRALAGKTVVRFASALPKLTRVDVDTGVTGRTIERVEADGKWLLMYFSGDLILLTHMLMSGSWHIYRPGERWRKHPAHMRMHLSTNDMEAVAFNVQIAEFHTQESVRRRRGYAQLGPSLLAADFDEKEALQRLQNDPALEIGQALLMQSKLAGIGNVFKSEICFACGVHPFRRVAELSISELAGLVRTAKKFLLQNVAAGTPVHIVTYAGMRRTTGRMDREENLWVYQRRGEPCRRCDHSIESQKQGLDARSTFWCPQCQPLERSLQQPV